MRLPEAGLCSCHSCMPALHSICVQQMKSSAHEFVAKTLRTADRVLRALLFVCSKRTARGSVVQICLESCVCVVPVLMPLSHAQNYI
mmetsp:Transcript_33411/g.83236  ORF Transcript_33411/g.83236 Transcript_33411/m.83236 type:complete len:87 (-) Transcript_33411:2-262(-)